MASPSYSGGNSPLSILLINQTWFCSELRARGHRVVTVGWNDDTFDICCKQVGVRIEDLAALLPSNFQSDRLVYYDDSGPVTIAGLERLSFPSLFLSVDAHHHHQWHAQLGAAFDAVLVSQKNYLDQYKVYNANSSWFPLWASANLSPQGDKSIEVSFRGNLNPQLHAKRAEFFERLGKLVDVNIRTDYYARIYPKSKIVINQVVDGDLNFRVFEAMISEALLITPRIENGLCELFEPGVDLVLYEDDNAEDAAEKIRYYLNHDEERRTIAKNGREKVMTFHTLQARAEMLEQHLLHLKVSERPRKHFGLAMASFVSSKIYRTISDEVAKQMLRQFREHLEAGFHAGEAEPSKPWRQEVESAVMLCKFAFEEEGWIEPAHDFMKLVFEIHPQSVALALGYIESVRNVWGDEVALKICCEISPSPQKLLEDAVEVVTALRSGREVDLV